VGPEQAHLGTTAKRPDVPSPKSPTEDVRLYIRRGIEKHLIQPGFYPQMTCDVFSEVRLLLFQLDFLRSALGLASGLCSAAYWYRQATHRT